MREEAIKAKLLRKIEQVRPRPDPRRRASASRFLRSAGSMRSGLVSRQARRPRGSPSGSDGRRPIGTPLRSPQTPARSPNTPLHQSFDVR